MTQVSNIEDARIKRIVTTISTAYYNEGREAANALFAAVSPKYRTRVASQLKEKLDVQRSKM